MTTEPHRAPPSVYRFDLRHLSDEYYRSIRPFRFLFIGMVGVFVIILLDGILMTHASRVGSQTWWTAVEAIAITAVLIPPSLWAVYSYFTRGPDMIELTAGAIILRYRTGPAVSVKWEQPSLKIRVTSFLPLRSGLSAHDQSETVGLRGPWHKYARINPDVSHAIIGYAESRGLRVERTSSKRSDGSWNTVLIEPPATTSGPS